jgi:site-specific recombinase XerC
MGGVNLRTVQTLLGHKDLRMIMRYSHLSPEHLREAVQNLDKSLTTKRGKQRELGSAVNTLMPDCELHLQMSTLRLL